MLCPFHLCRYDTDLKASSISWKDRLVPKLHQAAGVAHGIRDDTGRLTGVQGTITGLLVVSPEMPIGKPYAQLYRLYPNATRTRVALGARVALSDAMYAHSILFWTLPPFSRGSTPPRAHRVTCSTQCTYWSGTEWCLNLTLVPIHVFRYAHSFGLSDTHAVVCEHAWVFDSTALFNGQMLMNASVINPATRTVLHLIDLASGTAQAYVAPEAFLCIHFANVFSNGSAVLFDMPTWQTPPIATADTSGDTSGDTGTGRPCNPYALFEFTRLADPKARDAFDKTCRNTLVRHVRPLDIIALYNFEIFSRSWQLYVTPPHAPCDVLYLVPMLIGC